MIYKMIFSLANRPKKGGAMKQSSNEAKDGDNSDNSSDQYNDETCTCTLYKHNL